MLCEKHRINLSSNYHINFSWLIIFHDFAIAAMWSGVVPQQPPTIFTNPFSAYSRICSAINSGDSSYWPKAFGKPAFG